MFRTKTKQTYTRRLKCMGFVTAISKSSAFRPKSISGNLLHQTILKPQVSVLMQRLSYPTETVLSNKITRNRIFLTNTDSPRKLLGRRPHNFIHPQALEELDIGERGDDVGESCPCADPYECPKWDNFLSDLKSLPKGNWKRQRGLIILRRWKCPDGSKRLQCCSSWG